MILTMAGFAAEDVFIKLAAERVPVGEILLLLGIGGTAIMFVIARVNRTDLLSRDLLCAPMLIRTGSEILAMMFGMSALALLPLSLVTAIGQAGPIVTTLGAALFLAEPVGWRRWSAVAVGLCGVLLILRPGSAAFEPAMILSALAITFVAARDLATRRAPAVLSIMQLNFWGYFMTLPSGVLLMAINGKAPVLPGLLDWAYIGASLVLGVVFYFTLTLALRLGESSVVVPFRYTRLIFALALAALVFGERPDAPMLAGIALVTLSGLYTLWRESRQRRRPPVRPSPAPGAPL
jgi:drug/metabolite transporter (DMT)-like permease